MIQAVQKRACVIKEQEHVYVNLDTPEFDAISAIPITTVIPNAKVSPGTNSS